MLALASNMKVACAMGPHCLVRWNPPDAKKQKGHDSTASKHRILEMIDHMAITKPKSKGIVSWPQEERPRERLLSLGAEALTDSELIALLLRIGYKGTSAVELGRQLLKQFGSLRAMVEAPAFALLKVKGLKGAKAAQLLAAMEIARRVSIPVKRGQLRLGSTAKAVEYLGERLKGLAEEQFRVLYVNRRCALLEDTLVARGVVDCVRPQVRTIVAHALRTNASALIAGHNHPSGTAEPSESDKLLTRDLIAACHPIGIKVFDHVIVAGDERFSFADTGLLDQLGLETLAPTPEEGF